jgi:hypothetical protein
VSERDVKDASAGVLKDLKRFQLEKEEDLKRYMVFVTGCVSTIVVMLTRRPDRLCQMSCRLGQKECGNMERSERGG